MKPRKAEIGQLAEDLAAIAKVVTEPAQSLADLVAKVENRSLTDSDLEDLYELIGRYLEMTLVGVACAVRSQYDDHELEHAPIRIDDAMSVGAYTVALPPGAPLPAILRDAPVHDLVKVPLDVRHLPKNAQEVGFQWVVRARLVAHALGDDDGLGLRVLVANLEAGEKIDGPDPEFLPELPRLIAALDDAVCMPMFLHPSLLFEFDVSSEQPSEVDISGQP
jgi:hypothetical protein